MGLFYPQAALTLRLRLEDYAKGSNVLEFYELQVFAKTVTVNVNSYFEADTFTAQVEYKNFPFDPRAIRAVSVSVHAEDMKALRDEAGARKKIVPTEANTIFYGFADEDEIRFDDSSRMVTLEGRDLSALLIDEPFLKGTVPVTQTVDAAIQSLLNELPSTQKLKVDNRAGSLPILANFWSDKEEGSGRKNVRKNRSYWDVIQSIIADAGLICYMELDKLVISKPRILYDKSNAKVFIYGHNVKSLRFKRKIGRRKSFNLVVRALNLEQKKVIEAKIPEDATTEWLKRNSYTASPILMPRFDTDGKPLPDAELRPAPYISFRFNNIANKNQLIAVAEELFEEVARQEIEGSFSTREMSTSYRKLNKDGLPQAKGQIETFNVLSLRAGTPVAIVLDDQDMKQVAKTSNYRKRLTYLQSRGYDAKVAAILAETLGKYSNVFYTKGYRVNIDSQDGITFDVDFINFLDVEEKFSEFTT